MGDGEAERREGCGGADGLSVEAGSDAVDSWDGVAGDDRLDGGPGTDTRTTDASERSITGFLKRVFAGSG